MIFSPVSDRSPELQQSNDKISMLPKKAISSPPWREENQSHLKSDMA
ncbi:hypothetical protein HMPREF1141_1028 [Clostridium sp. MSTE9]|jgi:hypothetical protein|nr:hypothetical protein HMPREF1141_1028 [Clostridium sp. MSTE9]